MGSVSGINFINSSLRTYAPTTVIICTTITLLALKILPKCFDTNWGKVLPEKLGALALRIPYIRKKYDADIEKELRHFQNSFLKKIEPYGTPFLALPNEGLSKRDLVDLIDKYSNITSEKLYNTQFSGTIYSNSFQKKKESEGEIYIPFVDHESENFLPSDDFTTEDTDYFERQSAKLNEIFTYAFERSNLWNSLHSNEFAVGAFIEYQVVRIVADMFGGAPNEVVGSVTSGGTESLMLAVRAYRNWGIENRGLKPGQAVIIASSSVHASILKAGESYHVNVVLVPTDEEGRMDLYKLRQAVRKYKSSVVAIIGSAPSYPTGVVDDIEEMALIAQRAGCGFHVDCCLGGFIINNLSRNTDYLKIPGVTSLSVDTHKNGFAPKGSSVIVYKEILGMFLAYYAIYSLPGWKGGPYGSPKDAGSQSCVNSFNALLALLGTGKLGYRRMASEIHSAGQNLSKIIIEFDGRLKLIAPPEVNVVAFKIDENWGLQKGATYAFAHEMAKRHFVLNTLADDSVHFCVTIRFASNPRHLEQFKSAVKESLDAVEILNQRLVENGQKFPGDAGMYCALEEAMVPERKKLGLKKYVENSLFGTRAAHAVVKEFFMAQLDPYPPQEVNE